MRRVSRRRGAGDRGVVSTLPQQPALMLIGPNSELFGSNLHTTKIQRPTVLSWAFSFLLPANHAGFAPILRVPGVGIVSAGRLPV